MGIDLPDRDDSSDGVGQEDFVGTQEFVGGDGTVLCINPRVFREFEDQIAGDPGESDPGNNRCAEVLTFCAEDVGGCSFGHLPRRSEE